jgi:hypothetical protein
MLCRMPFRSRVHAVDRDYAATCSP